MVSCFNKRIDKVMLMLISFVNAKTALSQINHFIGNGKVYYIVKVLRLI